MKDIAVIGSGISGLAAAYLLSRRHRVFLFEREPRLGGHTHTIDVHSADGPLRLDTGFLVHNDRTYPNLIRLFEELGVSTQDSEMSFSVSCRQSGLEYSSRGAAGFFAQPRNLWRPRHLLLLAEIVRFNREARTLLGAGAATAQTLGGFLDARRFDGDVARWYLLPMAAAIWSASIRTIRDFPAHTLVRFLDNHGLLAISGQPTWKVVVGGSDTYVPALIRPLEGRIRTTAGLRSVQRSGDRVTVAFQHGAPATFDDVVFACHGDQVLPLLEDPSDDERAVFTGFTTTTNDVWLHTDTSVLPRQPRAHASWNYALATDPAALPTVTYDLNRLQRLRARERYCVTLNPQHPIDPSRVLRRLSYRHPQFTHAAIRAQALWHLVSGRRHTHFCGAYWGYGFHEDGVTSAIRVARSLGVTW